MTSSPIRFDRFELDPAERRLTRDGAPVELNGRYFDALALLLRENGKLVTKDRFMDEVWHGVPVTDEALTQCVRTLRRQLGDDAVRPRFIETVPKHGYRFIGEVGDGAELSESTSAPLDWSRTGRFAALGGIGGGIAGTAGGLAYGIAVSGTSAGGMGALSVLIVLMAVAGLLGLAGGASVGFGIAVSEFYPSDKWQWSTAGGMFGGLAIGALARLIGTDAFNLLIGNAPEQMTGSGEGALLGAAMGLAAWLGRERKLSVRRSALAGAAICGAAGFLIPLLNGNFLGGSLDLLSHSFPNSRFSLDAVGGLFGESGFGPIAETVTAALEGATFGGAMGIMMAVARKQSGAIPK